MERQGIQLAIYPTPASLLNDVIIESSLIDEIEKVCGRLSPQKDENNAIKNLNIRRHFRDLFAITDLTYHVEILTENPNLPAMEIWEKVHFLFPQFAWVRFSKEKRISNKVAYYLEFVPLVDRNSGFPFEISLQESVMQQLSIKGESAVQKAEEKILQVVMDALAERDTIPGIKASIEDKSIRGRIDDEDVLYAASEQANLLVKKDEFVIEQMDNQSVEPKIRYLEESIKREKSSKERLRNANEQLELVIEKLELSLLSSSLQYFENPTVDDSDWHKRIRVDLREYTILIQKAKYLEQMWHLNEKFVSKAEKMMISDNKLVYERNQVSQIKSEYSTTEINLVLYDCQLIENRSKINARPWFRKPNVKMLKMDYDELVNKAAYFDLLQGETYILERAVKEQETTGQASKEDG